LNIPICPNGRSEPVERALITSPEGRYSQSPGKEAVKFEESAASGSKTEKLKLAMPTNVPPGSTVTIVLACKVLTEKRKTATERKIAAL
jgi:hypothetical protein